jgi:GPI ethanolamine phosphate transferase 3 subunit O
MAFTAHKIWKILTTLLLLALTIQFTLRGFFKPKLNLEDKTVSAVIKTGDKRKVILLLADALREDFVEFDTDDKRLLDTNRHGSYKGKRMSIFRDARMNHPENSLLFPFRSEMPTVTSVRIRGMLSGGLSTFFETTSEFGAKEVREDNVLYQLKQSRGEQSTIAFYGDYIWGPMFGKFFDKSEMFNSVDLRDLDTLDSSASKYLLKELREGSNFDFMLGHIIGIDSAGHSFFAEHPEIERKLMDAQHIIADVMELMDDKTTLIVFGDHGMTDDGNHGGGSENEMRSVIFAYQKTPFPLANLYEQYKESFTDIDRTMKQVDLAAILSVLLKTSFPFSNIGVFHPLFAQTKNVAEINKMFIQNLEQIQQYLESYCAKTSQAWCTNQIDSFQKSMVEFKNIKTDRVNY